MWYGHLFTVGAAALAGGHERGGFRVVSWVFDRTGVASIAPH